MRAIRTFIVATLCLLSAAAPVYAQQATPAPAPAAAAQQQQAGAGVTKVTVTEKIPGMHCVPAVAATGGINREASPKTRLYKCDVEKGFGSVMTLLQGLIKYGTFIIALIGVLMIVASGVQISMSAIDSGMREDAKTRITQVLVGFAFLFLVSMILNTVAPWVYQ